mmetsp:Transcript_3404/g.8190  ORF Transcript_3404/g.8190 Transcript_3404/m.8190 type:complete len:117 (+) Transcript_3404:250-600(+)
MSLFQDGSWSSSSNGRSMQVTAGCAYHGTHNRGCSDLQTLLAMLPHSITPEAMLRSSGCSICTAQPGKEHAHILRMFWVAFALTHHPLVCCHLGKPCGSINGQQAVAKVACALPFT